MWKIVSTYISATFLIISVFLFGKIVLNNNVKLNNKKNLIIFELVCILQTITFLSFDGTIKTLIMLINNIILYNYNHKGYKLL